MSSKGDPYTSDEATRTWESVKDTPPRDPAGMNGKHPPVTGGYSWTDQGNAERLLDAGWRDKIVSVAGRQFPFYYWDGNRLRQDGTH
jgi:hypothetical protein